MSNIENRTLSQFITLTKDGEWGKSEEFDDSVPMKIIRGTDFDSVRLGDWTCVPTRYVARKHAELKAVRDEDLLIETAGGSPERPTGRSIFLKSGSVSGQTLPVTCASFARFIRIDADLIEPEFVFWWLQYQYVTRRLLAFQIQHTGVARFQWTTCSRSILVPSVDRKVQRSIAAVLSAYDDLIENNTRRIKLLEEMAQRIYREWFVDFRYPGHDAVPLVHSELGPIPRGWDWKQLRDIAMEIRVGVDPGAIDPETPYVGLEHMPEMSIALCEWGIAQSAGSRKFKFVAGDVLFGKIRPYFHKVSVAPVDGICSTDAVVVRSRTPDVYGIVVSVVSSDAFVAEAVQSSQGTKMPRANWSVLESYPIAMPPQHILEKFNMIVNDVVSAIHRMVHANRNLRDTRDLLLSRLLSGELDVSELDIAVPEAAT